MLIFSRPPDDAGETGSIDHPPAPGVARQVQVMSLMQGTSRNRQR